MCCGGSLHWWVEVQQYNMRLILSCCMKLRVSLLREQELKQRSTGADHKSAVEQAVQEKQEAVDKARDVRKEFVEERARMEETYWNFVRYEVFGSQCMW